MSLVSGRRPTLTPSAVRSGQLAEFADAITDQSSSQHWVLDTSIFAGS